MNLVFIHGRAQGGRKVDAIRDEWLGGLRAGFEAAGWRPTVAYQTLVPFYGDDLERLMGELDPPDIVRVVERGEKAQQRTVDPFTLDVIRQLAHRAGVNERQALDAAGVTDVEKGLEEWPWVRAMDRAIAERFPWASEQVIAGFTADVHAYLHRSHIRKRVHEIVTPALRQGPCVVVTHSLGSIVAYWLLTALTPRPEIRLLVTAGSPLGLDAIKEKLPTPRRRPAAVAHWLNVSDQRDIVALYPVLDRTTFAADIENIADINNEDEPHSISRYLSDRVVARRIADALG